MTSLYYFIRWLYVILIFVSELHVPRCWKHSAAGRSVDPNKSKGYLTNRMLLSVVCNLSNNDTRHLSGQNVVDSRSAADVNVPVRFRAQQRANCIAAIRCLRHYLKLIRSLRCSFEWIGAFSSKTLVSLYINADVLKLHHMQALLNIQMNCNNIEYWDYLHLYIKHSERDSQKWVTESPLLFPCRAMRLVDIFAAIKWKQQTQQSRHRSL